MYTYWIKPFIDKLIALVVLVLFSPILVFLIVVLSMANQGRPFFRQQRPGRNGKLFFVLKFKTMNDRLDEKGSPLPDEQRLTSVGRMIRKTSLDELPQLVNVLLGDMSLVGPRPLLPEYLHLYNAYQRQRMQVKPGITGWAQINGRNSQTWDQRFDYDIWYVKNISFWLDLKIVCLTLLKVVRSEGISSESSATMEKFRGNN